MNTGRKNQRQRIFDLLVVAQGGEVPSVALSRISLQYGARVKELREMGFNITNRTERRAGQVHGYFRLERGVHTKMCRTGPPTPDLSKIPNTFPEFGSLVKESYGVD